VKKLNPLNTVAGWGERGEKTHFKGGKIRSPGWGTGNTPQTLPEAPRPRTRVDQLAAEAAAAEHRLTVRVLGVGGSKRQGVYTLPFKDGAPLSHYLKLLGLLRVATKARVYDMAYFALGRRRLNYIPRTNSEIYIGGSNYTPVSGKQRSSRDAMAIAKSMGGGAKVVEAPLVGRDGQIRPSASIGPKASPLDEHDVDQF
jgi:hypothetical protein